MRVENTSAPSFTNTSTDETSPTMRTLRTSRRAPSARYDHNRQKRDPHRQIASQARGQFALGGHNASFSSPSTVAVNAPSTPSTTTSKQVSPATSNEPSPTRTEHNALDLARRLLQHHAAVTGRKLARHRHAVLPAAHHGWCVAIGRSSGMPIQPIRMWRPSSAVNSCGA